MSNYSFVNIYDYFINLDNNKHIKVIKPGDPKFNYYEYEFNFSDFKTVNNNYLLISLV